MRNRRGADIVGGEDLRTVVYTDGTYNYYCDAPHGSLLTAAVWHIERMTIASSATVHAYSQVGTSAAVLALVNADFNGGSIL